MSFIAEEERREKGASLKQFEAQAASAVNQLKSIKTNINALRATVVADGKSAFGAGYVTDVDAKITAIADNIDTIQFGS